MTTVGHGICGSQHDAQAYSSEFSPAVPSVLKRLCCHSHPALKHCLNSMLMDEGMALAERRLWVGGVET